MAAGKLIVFAFGLLLVVYLGGFFGPGPLVPGLGPAFDQIVTFTVVILLVVVAVPWLLRSLRKNDLEKARSRLRVRSRITERPRMGYIRTLRPLSH